MSLEGMSMNSVIDVQKSENYTYFKKICTIQRDSKVVEAVLKVLAFIGYFITLVLPFRDLCVTIIELISDRQKSTEIEKGKTLKNFLKGDKINSTFFISYAKALTKTIIDSLKKAEILCEIAIAQAHKGDIKAAKFTADEITCTNRKAEALCGIAIAQARKGDIEGAKFTAAEIVSTGKKEEALCGIAIAQARKGEIEGAKSIAAEIVSTGKKEEALCGIAIAQAHKGDIEGAKSTAAEITYYHRKAEVLCGIAIAQAHKGDINGAKDTFEEVKTMQGKINHQYDKNLMLEEIVKGQLTAGLLAEAKDTIGIMESVRKQAGALLDCIIAYAENGDIVTAKKILKEVEEKQDAIDKEHREEYRLMADKIFRSWNLENVSEITRALSRIKNLQISNGDTTEAEETFQKAKKVIEEAKKEISKGLKAPLNDYLRTNRWAKHWERIIIKAQVEIGDVKGAIATALKKEDPYCKARLLVGIYRYHKS